MYKKNLSTYVEVISDDFQSTFTVHDNNTLINMLGFDGDFERLTEIIHNYLPDVKVKFIKSNMMGVNEVYDMYFIKVEE